MADLDVEDKQLRKDLTQMRMEQDIVKKRLRTLPGNSCKVYAHEGMAKPIPLTVMAKMLDVFRSGWLKRPPMIHHQRFETRAQSE